MAVDEHLWMIQRLSGKWDTGKKNIQSNAVSRGKVYI